MKWRVSHLGWYIPRLQSEVFRRGVLSSCFGCLQPNVRLAEAAVREAISHVVAGVLGRSSIGSGGRSLDQRSMEVRGVLLTVAQE